MSKKTKSPVQNVMKDSTPLSSWPLPSRMTKWLKNEGARTVGDLLALDPDQLARSARGLGKRSISDTDAVIRERLGVSWREVRSRHRARALEQAVEPVSPSVAAALEQPLKDFAFPVRLCNWAERAGVSSLGELVRRHPTEVKQQRAVGESTIQQAEAVLQEQLGRSWESLHAALSSKRRTPTADVFQEIEEHRRRLLAKQERLYDTGFRATVDFLLADLDLTSTSILERRSGLGGESQTLDEIGASLRISGERVRQLEKRAWRKLMTAPGLVDYIEAKCREVAPWGAVPVDELEAIEWWEPLAREPFALGYFCSRLVSDRWQVLQLEDRLFLGRCSQQVLDQATARGWRAMRAIEFPQSLVSTRHRIYAATKELPAALKEQLWESMSATLVVQGGRRNSKVLSHRLTRHAEILRFLESRHQPVSLSELKAGVTRVGNLPEDVFHFGHGIVGVERHFPAYRAWQAKLVPQVVELMRQRGPARQWSSVELLPLLRSHVDIPAWLDEWHLAEVLRRAEEVDYLGRWRVVLPGANDSGKRLHVHEFIHRILHDAGAPLPRQELTSRVRERMDCTETAVSRALLRPEFVEVTPKTWGLTARDLPGGRSRKRQVSTR